MVSLSARRTPRPREAQFTPCEHVPELRPIEAKLRIGLDGSFLLVEKPQGAVRYIIELCKQLDWLLPQAEFFLYAPRSVKLPPFFSTRWVLRTDEHAPFGPFAQTRWLLLRVGRLCRQDSLDVFWATGILAPYLSGPTKLVLTVHDLAYIDCPETMILRHWLTNRLFFKSGVERASAIVTNSQGTARRVRDVFQLGTAAVVRPAVAEGFFPRPPEEIDTCLQELGVARPYLLAVARREPRKNLELLVRTFLKMKDSGALPRHMLVLAGTPGWKNQRLQRLLASVDRDTIASLGYVPDHHLPALYSGCDLFVFPSKYEGFGMPVAEARVCGARVVASDIPELREAGDEHVVYVPPTEEELSRGILEALSRPKPPPMAVTEASSWKASAATLADVFVRLCKAG